MTTVQAKDPNVAAVYELDLWEALVIEARRSYAFALNDVVRAQRDTGLYYVCTKAGRTKQNYPDDWPRAANDRIMDGTVEWQATDPADATPPSVQSVTWIVPSGLTLDSQSEGTHVVSATLSGGTDGEDYDVTARITPTTGTPRDVTITIPVRQQ